MKKNIFLIFLIIFSALYIFTKQKIPLVVSSQKNVFNKIFNEIEKTFPDNVEILVYDIYLFNGSDDDKKRINENFYNIATANQSKYKYKVKFEKDIIIENSEIDVEAIKNQSELDLLAFGKFLNLDIVLLSSVTIIENVTKNIWNTEEKKVFVKKIALFQGDFISTENNISIFKFSYYFLLE